MKSVQRNSIIALMALALAGIIAVQAYWINTALEQSKIQFERNVQETLVQVAQRLEEQEASQATAQSFIFYGDDDPNIVFTTPNTNETFSIGRASDGNVSITTSAGVEIQADTMHVKGYSYNSSKVIKSIEKRAQLVDVAINRILKTENVVITDRIDSVQLDSLLGQSLHEKGIHLAYEYAVFNVNDETGEALLSNASQPVHEVFNSDFQASLFPSDLDGSSHFLSVYFPGQSAFILRRIGTTLAASILFIGIILGTFIYTLRIISRQKKLSQMKNDFINNMTHELKTPIATISLATQVLAEQEVQESKSAIQKYIGVIRDENSRLTRQVEQVLQSALLEKKQLQLSKEQVSLHDLLGDALETFASVNAETKVTWNFNASSDEIIGDIHHLTNVLNNLLDNAVKYSGDTKPNILVWTDNHDKYIRIHVRDHGIGMEPGQVRYIFDSFYRISTGNLHDVKGFGLGLSYVQHIVDQHGGEIDVTSEPGKGSEFIISLPNV